jgi:hypothetical protein
MFNIDVNSIFYDASDENSPSPREYAANERSVNVRCKSPFSNVGLTTGAAFAVQTHSNFWPFLSEAEISPEASRLEHEFKLTQPFLLQDFAVNPSFVVQLSSGDVFSGPFAAEDWSVVFTSPTSGKSVDADVNHISTPMRLGSTFSAVSALMLSFGQYIYRHALSALIFSAFCASISQFLVLFPKFDSTLLLCSCLTLSSFFLSQITDFDIKLSTFSQNQGENACISA